MEREMDGTTVSAAGKSLDALRSVPTWVLIGSCICIFLVWLWPPLLDSAPESLRSIVPIALLLVAILTICKILNSGLTQVLERRRRLIAHDRKRLINLYRPLASLFLTRHVTVSTGISAPYLRHRLENARSELDAYGRRTVRLKRAWRALFDRQASSTAEIQFGGDFPLSQIIDMVKRKPGHADPELLRLINHADRSRYEESDRGLLTSEEYALFEYIDREHHRLSQRAG